MQKDNIIIKLTLNKARTMFKIINFGLNFALILFKIQKMNHFCQLNLFIVLKII